jgi:hypothetical protein
MMLATLVAGGLVMAGILSAEQPAEPEQPAVVESTSEPDAERSAHSPELHDAAFERFVDLGRLGEALAGQDAGALADIGLQLAEGERVLLRSHKGITADRVLSLAVRTAADTRNTEVLDRLERAGKELKKEQLLTQIEATRKVAGQARASGLTLTIDPTQDLSGLLAYQNFLTEIDQAKTLRDRETLKVLKEGVDAGPKMDDKLRKQILTLINQTLETMPTEAQPGDDVLQKLMAANRGSSGGNPDDERAIPPQEVSGAFLTNPNSLNARIWNYCRNNFLPRQKRVGNGQCAVLNQYAIQSATGRNFRITGNPTAEDYVWGRRIGVITHARIGDARHIEAGDLLQFRNAYFQGRTASGGTYWSNASHHSAVVMGTRNNGTIIDVFQQNSGGKLYVTHGVFRLADMKDGTIWVYRAQ